MVTPLFGYPNPELIRADLMRSRLSRTAVSGMPTMMKSLGELGWIHIDFDIDRESVDPKNRRATRSVEGHKGSGDSRCNVSQKTIRAAKIGDSRVLVDEPWFIQTRLNTHERLVASNKEIGRRPMIC